MREIQIPGPEGQLRGIWHPAMRETDRFFIISHGFNGSIDGTSRAALLAEAATHLGFHALRYEFTPCQSLAKQIAELDAVVRYVREKMTARIYLLGRSMGGSASLSFAYQDQNISGLCLWSTPGNLSETFQLTLGADYERLQAGESVTLSDENGSITLQPDFVQGFEHCLFDFVKALSGVPLLIIHGSDDAIVPLKQAQTMYEAAGNPKKLIVIPGGDHQFIGKAEQARQHVLQWLKTLSSSE